MKLGCNKAAVIQTCPLNPGGTKFSHSLSHSKPRMRPTEQSVVADQEIVKKKNTRTFGAGYALVQLGTTTKIALSAPDSC